MILPHEIIDPQLEAYRARDLLQFVAFYSSDIQVYRSGVLYIAGKADLRIKYKEIFDTSPNLAIEISDRKIKGGYIHDTELITGLRGNLQQITAQVRYKIENSKIAEVMISF